MRVIDHSGISHVLAGFEINNQKRILRGHFNAVNDTAHNGSPKAHLEALFHSGEHKPLAFPVAEVVGHGVDHGSSQAPLERLNPARLIVELTKGVINNLPHLQSAPAGVLFQRPVQQRAKPSLGSGLVPGQSVQEPLDGGFFEGRKTRGRDGDVALRKQRALATGLCDAPPVTRVRTGNPQ